jgi:UDP-N-acetylmuramyl pentapeptide phosphotransferase/UDP-N-acetylglucosamine-1-phosphate transferase
MAVLPYLACVGAVTAAVAAGVRFRWFRETRNFEGRRIAIGGAALVLGILAGLALAARERDFVVPAMLVAVAGFGLFGALDDRWGDRSASGFRGHFRAAARGRFTTGFWKVAGGGAVALAASWLLARPAGWETWALFLIRAAVVALAANAMNLLDTRPVRALAVFLAAALLAALAWRAAPLWVAIAGAAAFLPWDRRRAVMLGDAGSNAIGAAWGVAMAAYGSSIPLLVALALLIALHVYTEGHSLNAEIVARPWLARLDAGLRGMAPNPAGPPPVSTATKEERP